MILFRGGAPVYHRQYREPKYFSKWKEFNINKIEEPNLVEVAKYLTGHENIASSDGYMSNRLMVGTINMSTNFPTDAGIVNLKGTNRVCNDS